MCVGGELRYESFACLGHIYIYKSPVTRFPFAGENDATTTLLSFFLSFFSFSGNDTKTCQPLVTMIGPLYFFVLLAATVDVVSASTPAEAVAAEVRGILAVMEDGRGGESCGGAGGGDDGGVEVLLLEK